MIVAVCLIVQFSFKKDLLNYIDFINPSGTGLLQFWMSIFRVSTSRFVGIKCLNPEQNDDNILQLSGTMKLGSDTRNMACGHSFSYEN